MGFLGQQSTLIHVLSSRAFLRFNVSQSFYFGIDQASGGPRETQVTSVLEAPGVKNEDTNKIKISIHFKFLQIRN